MDGQIILDGFDEPDVLALGMRADQLAAAAGAAILVWCLLHTAWPAAVQWPLAAVLSGCGASLGLVRWQGRPGIEWAVLGLRYRLRPRRGVLFSTEDDADQPWTRWLRDDPAPNPVGPAPVPPPETSPEPADAHTEPPSSAADTGRGDELGDLPEGELELDNDNGEAVIIPLGLRLADEDDSVIGEAPAPPAAPPGPFFAGATRRITFFSLNGGSGKTTLAVEVAGLLAARGVEQPRNGASARRLKVALLDLDTRSPTVSVRLGVPHPTVWDYLQSPAGETSIDDFMVTHRSGLRALLGPPKPLSTQTAIDCGKLSAIVRELEADGCHFIVIDVAADLGPASTWALHEAHDIFIVLTPTAGGLQDAYRSTEVLRRLGMRHKISYVVNRSRGGGFSFRDTMSDLDGRIAAEIAFDPRLEEAENRHTIASLEHDGGAVDGLRALAAHVYPGLATAPSRRRVRLPWRRHAG